MATSLDNPFSEEEPGTTPEVAKPAAWSWSWPARLGFVGAGVVSPLICFATATISGLPLFEPWQSGETKVYVGLLLSDPSTVAVFFPLLAYSMVTLMLVTFKPHRFGQVFVVRVGVYTGVVLAIQYMVLLALYESFDPSAMLIAAMAVGIPLGVGGAIHLVARKFGQKRVWLSVLFLAIFAGLVWFMVSLLQGTRAIEVLQLIVGVPYFLCLFFGTYWAVAAYTIMSLALVRRFATYRMQMSLFRLMGVFSLISVYMAAWRISINQMLEAYVLLPKEQPGGCYICTAAARGHGWVVKSQVFDLTSGRTMHVNDQMRTLKCAELVLAQLAPPMHTACRMIYDRLGPPLAALLIHPLLADAAYLAFKLPEWSARLALRMVLPRDSDVVRRIY
jgi:hypothetical protein